MRNFTLIFALLLMGIVSYAQDTITVVPDYDNGGALNKAIADNGPNKIYKLEVNGFYTLTSTLELLRPEDDPTAWYEIVGEIPASEEDYMPVLQTGLTPENLPFYNMFNVTADVSIKNIFIANQTATAEIGNFVMLILDSVRLEMDGCMVDPVGIQGLMNGNEFSIGSNVFVTNNTMLRHGDKFSPNGGHLFWGVITDTTYIENNSFISTDAGLLALLADDMVKNIQFLWFNHNTVVYHDVSLIPNEQVRSTYVTNNLFYDLATYVQQHGWAQFGSSDNATTGCYPTLIRTDTAYVDGQLEPLPSSRINMWNRNLVYVSPAVRDTILGAAANDPTDNQLWQYPVLWNDEVPHYYVTDWDSVGQDILDAAREAKMFDSPDFPNFVEDNTWYDVNPGFVDARVEEFSKEVASSAMFWYRLNNLLKGENPAEQYSQFWDVDEWAGTTAAMYPTVWPRWDGAYTNETLLTASTAALPLGDLNAFPDQKAVWELNQEKIAKHILDLKTDQVTDLERPVGVEDMQFSSDVSIYPNPANTFIHIESAIAVKLVSIYSITGSLVHQVNSGNIGSESIDISELTEGMYIIKLDFVNGATHSSKLTKK